MATKMLIDASHPEETRVAVVDGERLEEFDFETSIKTQNKGNVYLARVSRVEPSLQAAFVDYGGNRQGFLAFSEIHPDYYQIPIDDRKSAVSDLGSSEIGAAASDPASNDADEPDVVDEPGDRQDTAKRSERGRRSYRIQEVIKRRQVLLIQVTKEERGTKGAAVTTYISLPGRYCVLMPNTLKGGGVSRKIDSGEDRRRLRSIVNELKVPKGMAVIIRTAGQERNRAEIKRDLDYLLRLWEIIRESTLRSVAPYLIYEEANLIKRSIRDLYRPEFEGILVQGDEGYRIAKAFMRTMMPSRAKLVQPYRDKKSLFRQHKIEEQLEHMHDPVVGLPSGGYLVINPTEALVAVDVNSGSATKERSIEETALKTNMEASEAIARQMKLRDLAGLVVVDFIDMAEARNNRAVERKLREAFSTDRARVQMGRISVFGLLEFSRQRLRPSLLEVNSVTCFHCGGSGRNRSTESLVMQALRELEEEGLKGNKGSVEVTMPRNAAMYLLNGKRQSLSELEAEYEMRVFVTEQNVEDPAGVVIAPIGSEVGDRALQSSPIPEPESKPEPRGRPNNSKKGRPKGKQTTVKAPQGSSDMSSAATISEEASEENERVGAGRGRPRRRGRRGGRRRNSGERSPAAASGAETQSVGEVSVSGVSEQATQAPPAGPLSKTEESEGPLVVSSKILQEEAAEMVSKAQSTDAIDLGSKPPSGKKRRTGRRRSSSTKEDTSSSGTERKRGASRRSTPASLRRPSSEVGEEVSRGSSRSKKGQGREAGSGAGETEVLAEVPSARSTKRVRDRKSRTRSVTKSGRSELRKNTKGEAHEDLSSDQAEESGHDPEGVSNAKRRKGWWQRVTGS